MPTLVDDRLVAAMRQVVVATNKLEHHKTRSGLELSALESLLKERDAAGIALQEALLERGWRRPAW